MKLDLESQETKFIIKVFALSLLILSFFSIKTYAQTNYKYSFFVAGHVYGSPLNPHYGIHYPFADYIDNLNNNPKIDLGFLSGDVVLKNTADYWDSAMVDFNRFEMPWHIAAGNHDMGQEFVNRFGDYYFNFVKQNDLYIILCPGLDKWNISGDQLEFLTNTLDSNYQEVDNIFIIMHQLIWWSPTNKYKDVKINYEPNYPGPTNYEDVVLPLLKSYPNKITVYAGDIGCRPGTSPVMYDNFDNITLIASGMGNGEYDNIIITDVYSDTIIHNIVAINNEDEGFMGKITDWAVNPSSNIYNTENELLVYPNPTTGSMKINNKEQIIEEITVYNLIGKELFKMAPSNSMKINIDLTNFSNGIYIMIIRSENDLVKRKIIKE